MDQAIDFLYFIINNYWSNITNFMYKNKTYILEYIAKWVWNLPVVSSLPATVNRLTSFSSTLSFHPCCAPCRDVSRSAILVGLSLPLRWLLFLRTTLSGVVSRLVDSPLVESDQVESRLVEPCLAESRLAESRLEDLSILFFQSSSPLFCKDASLEMWTYNQLVNHGWWFTYRRHISQNIRYINILVVDIYKHIET